MKEMKYTIKDQMGIHARPAGLLVKQASAFPCKITITKGEKEMDLKRILGVMGLGVKFGEEITIRCEGDQEEQAAEAIETFLKENL